MAFPPSVSAPQMLLLKQVFPHRVERSFGLSSWHCDTFYLRIALYADGSSPMKEQHLGVVGSKRGGRAGRHGIHAI